MKLGPLLLLSLLLHGVLLLALLAAPASRVPAPPPEPALVWMPLAAPAPAPAATAAPAPPATSPAAAPPAEPAAPPPAPAAASRSSQPRATARSAPLVPAAESDDPGIELPIEADADAEPGDAASRSSASVRAVSGPALSVPALPGPVRAGPPPSAPSFDARAYADAIRRRIDAEKQYPARARRLGLQGVATVLVAVDSRGRLARPPRLARTSGVAALDDEALRMVQAAAPFTPPAGAAPAATPLEVQVPVRFSLADAP